VSTKIYKKSISIIRILQNN